ncbi:MAG: hypothetical protein GY868_04215, partial [Deltaproteobacteria bacterium]|nr:hypothetical protein [Deltaproteobacteria bacterium]
LSLKKRGRNNYVMLEGFLLNVVDGAVNDKRLNDFMYIPVSTRMQGRQEFSCGDMICLTGSLDTKKGSLRLRAIRSYEIIQRGEPCYWTAGRARVAQKTGTVLSYQNDKCHRCDKGILMDIHRESRLKRGDPRRTLFCLEGVAEPDFCSYHIRQKLSRDTCPQDEPEDESAGK